MRAHTEFLGETTLDLNAGGKGRGNLEETGGKRVLGRGRQKGEWDPISHELCEVFILRVVGRILCQTGTWSLLHPPKQKMDREGPERKLGDQ